MSGFYQTLGQEDIIMGAGSATFSAGFVYVSAGPGDIDANTERVTFSPGASNLPANFFFIKFPKLAMFSPDLSWFNWSWH